ncbi:MAG: hypothetical protein WCA08_15750 [Desulfoferrobacter sp.]
MHPYDFAQFPGQGENDMEVPDGKKALAAFIKPALGVFGIAFRTVPVAAGMIGVVDRCATVALEHMPSVPLWLLFGCGLSPRCVLDTPYSGKKGQVSY